MSRTDGRHLAADRLQDLVDGLVGSRGVRHAVVGVEVGRTGERQVVVAGTAAADGRPMAEHTPYHFTSVTKLLTTVVVGQLHEEGQLDLDAPMAHYLPLDLIEGLHRLDGVDHTGRITIRHLLSHTSGLADYFLGRPSGTESYAEAIAQRDVPFSLDDVVERVRRLPPRFAPQAPGAQRRAHYSDTNFQLLGAVVEAVTGSAFHRVVTERVLEPHSLDSSWFAGHPRRPGSVHPVATMWAGDVPLERPESLRSMHPDGGLIGTVDDALTFVRALMSGQLFARPGTLDELQRHWIRFGLPRDRTALAAPTWPIASAAGITRFSVARVLVPGLVPTVVLGHSGASGSWAFHLPAHDLSVAGTIDQTDAAAVPYRMIPRLLRSTPT